MIRFKKYFSLFISMYFSIAMAAQDNTRTLSPAQLLQMVKQFHPIARQANINIEKAKADITTARAGFDPLLYNSTAQKKFAGTDYYYYNKPNLTIPTWFGIDVTGGLEFLSGNRTDNEDTKGETSYFGVSVPLAKNLLMDKRRAVLKTSKIFAKASEIERNAILNDLVLDALNTYWEWVAQYQLYKIASGAVTVNEQRMNLIRIAYRQGDRPAIDTTEALTQLQSFQLLQSQAWVNFQNTSLELSTFLWSGNDQPYNLPVDIVPDTEALQLTTDKVAVPELNELLQTARINHPELLQYNYKLESLEVEKKLKFQNLLPTVNFRYNQLGKGYDVLKTATSSLFENNFQYGLTLGVPLRLSEGRGEYKKAKLKIAETKIQQSQKTQLVEVKVRSYFNELLALQKQINIQERAYGNYATLQRGEEIKFINGESSLFLINSRENKTLEAQQKLTELKKKYFQNYNKLQWSSGQLWQQ